MFAEPRVKKVTSPWARGTIMGSMREQFSMLLNDKINFRLLFQSES